MRQTTFNEWFLLALGVSIGLALNSCGVSSSTAGGFASASEIASPAAGIRCFAISDVNNNVVAGSCLQSQ